MRVHEAAKKIGVSADMLRRLDRGGKISLSRDLNGHRRVTDADIELLRRIIYPAESAEAKAAGH